MALVTIYHCGLQPAEHLSYSPNIAPLDYYSFPKMKKKINGQHFAKDSDIIDAVDMYMENQDSSFYKEGYISSVTARIHV